MSTLTRVILPGDAEFETDSNIQCTLSVSNQLLLTFAGYLLEFCDYTDGLTVFLSFLCIYSAPVTMRVDK